MKRLCYLAAFISMLACATSHAATFTVTNILESGPGSLSNAIAQVNLTVGVTNMIVFNILPLDGTVKTIFISNGLPSITRSVIIDGYTQDPTHSHTNTLANADDAVLLIELNGTNAPGIYGLQFGSGSGSSGSVVRGLVINNFGAAAISSVNQSSGIVIEGNFIGTDPSGKLARPNVRTTSLVAAMTLDCPGIRIGGTSTGARNIISGNHTGGIVTGGGGNNLIQGNFIGVDATGTNTLGNAVGIGLHGVWLFGSSDVVGGTNVAARNVISGNGGNGIVVNQGQSPQIHDVTIQGNYIGIDANGTRLLPNGLSGVAVNESTNLLIGGAAAVAGTPPGNLIAGNGSHGVGVGNFIYGAFSFRVQGNIITANQGDGVLITTHSARDTVSSNSIFANGGLGIELTGDANNAQTNPIITSVTSGGGNVTLAGSLQSGSNAVFRLEFFSNASCDGSGFGEGQVFLGSTNVTTDASGSASFSLTLTNPVSHANFTATATDTNGNTSMFSPCASVSGPCVITCPSNMVVSTTANACGAVVNFFPTTSGNCGAVNCSPPSGSFFAKGTNTVACTSATGTNCSFTITVLDTIAPNIMCPANIVTNAPFGQTNAVVNFSPTVSDNCPGVTTNCSPASGSIFPAGTTTVTCTATDTSGNTNACSFTVTVNQTFPGSRFWTNSLGGNYHDAANWLSNTVPLGQDTAYFTNNASYTVSWTNDAVAAAAYFNSGSVTQSLGAFSWLVTNQYIVGNDTSLVATVVQTSGALLVTNRIGSGVLNVGPPGGTYQLTGTNSSVVTDYLFGDFGMSRGNKVLVTGGGSFRVNEEAAFGTFDSQSGSSNLLLVADPGSTLTSGNLRLERSTTLVISNGAKVSPVFTYIGYEVLGSGSTNNRAIVTGAGSLLNSSGIEIGGFGSRRNELIVSNSATVSGAGLIVGRNSTPDNRLIVDGGSVYITNILQFSAGPLTNQLNHTGLIVADPLEITNTAIFEFNGGTLDLGGARVTNGQVFAVGDGSTAATLNVRGNGNFSFANGLTLRSMASLTGNGRIGGTLLAQSGSTIAPGASVGKIVLTNSPALQGAMFMEISKSGTTLTNDQLQVLASLTYGGTLTVSNIGPDALVPGNRFQLFNATSYAGSFSSISLPFPGQGLIWTNKLLVDGSIEVISNQLPVAVCRNVTTNAGATCTANVSVAAVDNGSFDPDGTIVTRTLSPAGPYPKGTNLVTLTVVDDQGSSNSCTATIIVLDTTPPTITCPANVVTNVPHNQTAVVVNYTAPSVSDNCSGTLTTSCAPPPGVPFQLGVTTVTCTATDASGNTNSCSFTVTVNPAATLTWSGAGTNAFWTNAANWVGNVAPANGDALVFPTNATRLVNTNTAPISLASITLKGSNYVIYSPPITIFAGLTNLPPAGRTNRLEAALALAGDQTWVVPALTLASNVDLATVHLTLSGCCAPLRILGNVTGAAGSMLDHQLGELDLNGPANDVPNLVVEDQIFEVNGVLSGGLTLLAGTTLQGTGTVPAFTCAGNFIPGGSFSPGRMTVSSGQAVFTSGSDFQADLFGSTNPGINYDQLKVSTPPDLSGAALYVTPAYSATNGETFVIITNTGAMPFTTTFPGYPEGKVIVFASPANEFRISYVGGDGNDVTLKRVPIGTATAPRLTIQQATATAVRLLWPTNPPGFSLEFNTNLNTTNWFGAFPAPTILGTNNVVTNATTPVPKFYRVKK